MGRSQMGGNKRAPQEQQLEVFLFFSSLLSLSSFKEESLGYMYAGALKVMAGSEI